MGYYRPKGMVEAHQHDGSSTSANRLYRWINEGYYPESEVSTRDYRNAEIVNHSHECIYLLAPMEWIVKDGNSFFVMTDIHFKGTYEEI